MPNTDNYETPKSISSHRDLEQRQADRLAGKLNRRIRGSAIREIQEDMMKSARARMAEQDAGLRELPLFEPGKSKPLVSATSKKKANKTKKGFPVPKKKWSENRGRSSN